MIRMMIMTTTDDEVFIDAADDFEIENDTYPRKRHMIEGNRPGNA